MKIININSTGEGRGERILGNSLFKLLAAIDGKEKD